MHEHGCMQAHTHTQIQIRETHRSEYHNPAVQGHFGEVNSCQTVKKFLPFMKPKGPLSCSQKTPTDPILSQLNPVHTTVL